MGAWIETRLVSDHMEIYWKVAPRVGAWIETKPRMTRSIIDNKSHPVWVRGLKQPSFIWPYSLSGVAPRVGAWIETNFAAFFDLSQAVAPRVGAWIETIEKNA